MPPGLMLSAALPVAGSTLEFLPLADSFHEWSLPQHRWNPLHTPHFHSWELTTKQKMRHVKTIVHCRNVIVTQFVIHTDYKCKRE